MPLSYESIFVAGFREELRKDGGVLVQMLARISRVRDPVAKLMHAGQ